MSSPKLQKTNSAAFEAQNVHEVYDQIAEHFDSTRYKVECLFVVGHFNFYRQPQPF